MSGGDLITDLTTLKANTLTLGADIGALKFNSDENAYLAAVSAAATESQNISDVVKDIGTEASNSQAFKTLEKYSGLANLSASALAVYADASEIYSEHHDGAIKSSTIITALGDTISLVTNIARVGAEATAIAATFPEDAAMAAAVASVESVGLAAGSLTGSALTALGSIMNYTEARDASHGTQSVNTNSGANYSWNSDSQTFNVDGNGIGNGVVKYQSDGSPISADIPTISDPSDAGLPSSEADITKGSDGTRVEEQSNDGKQAEVCVALTHEDGTLSTLWTCTTEDETNEINKDIVQNPDGSIVDTTHNYDSNGTQTSYTENFLDAAGNDTGSATYTPSGGYISGTAGNDQYASEGGYGNGDVGSGAGGDYGDGSGGDGSGGDGSGGDGSGSGGGYGDGGYDDGGYQFTRATKLKGVDIGAIARLDKALGESGAAAAAERAHKQAIELASGHDPHRTASQLENGKWALPQTGAKIVTWSLATLAGPKAAPFSSYMGSHYATEVKKAFTAWAKATGITFKEVADGASADIRVGFGNFDTAKSGVAGYTSFRDKNGAIQAGAVIRVEDPSQDPLVHGASGGLHYSKSGINLQQLLEHEIGHAIGFANNADPNSIMYYMGSDTLHGLDAADKQAAKSLYQSSVANDLHAIGHGSGSTASASLAQALAAFAPAAGSLSSFEHETAQSHSMQLAANRHMALAA